MISESDVRWILHLACKHDMLDSDQIKELIDLDKAPLLSPNYRYISKFERRFITQFLLEHGVFDHMPD